MTELKPCPFCNEPIQLVNRPWINGDAGWEIEHMNPERTAKDKCPMDMACYDTEQEAIEAWNTRHEPIIRCRDCKHYDYWNSDCRHFALGHWDEARQADILSFCEVEPNGYCAWGEMRDA